MPARHAVPPPPVPVRARRRRRVPSKALGVLAALLLAVTAGFAIGVPLTGTANPDTAPAPPVRAAFYYPWFPETEHWATRYTPALGQYDSSNPTVLATHITQAKYAGLDAFIASYWGVGSKTAGRFPLLLDAARAQQFHIAGYYEPASKGVTDANLTADLDSLAGLAVDPAWLHIGGRPVLFVYNTGGNASCAGAARFVQANAGRFYLNLKVFGGYRSCPTQPDSWHQYGPAAATDKQGVYAYSISPGFNKFNEAAPRLGRDLTRWDANVKSMVASAAQWQLVTTFNEWGEGTAVEPAVEWQSPSGFGDYLDVLRKVILGLDPSDTPTITTSATATETATETTTASASTSASDTATPTVTPTAPAPSGKVAKVLTFIVENHSLDQMKTGMPYTYSQAVKYGYASNYTAIRHPSLPNYLALAGGSTFGVTDDAAPTSHQLTGPNVFGAAIKAGGTAKAYQEGMTSNCQTTNTGKYAVKHNPWPYWTDDRTRCQAFDVPSGTVTAGDLRNDIVNGNLPTVGEVTPDLCNDAHDCSLATADTWIKDWLALIYASPDWKSGELAVVITADEDNNTTVNKVLTVVAHPSLSGVVVTGALTHYSWTHWMTDLASAPCIGSGCSAASLGGAFGL